MSAVSVVYGVDGARGGWAVAAVRVGSGHGNGNGNGNGNGQSVVHGVTWHYQPGQDAEGLARLLSVARRDGAVAVGMDCPIGLPSSGWRPCDLAAKRRLGRGSARVFLAPPRAVLAAPSYADARAVARELIGKGVSAQAFGIRRIVLAVDAALREGSAGRGRNWANRHVVEVHPELSFMAMTTRPPGDPLPSKRTPTGRRARLDAVARWVDPVAVQAPDGDDHLDALAAAWSAWRWARGEAEVLGGERDEAGLPMRIVI